jgi:hypothetical protein
MPRLQVSEISTGKTNVLERGMLNQHQTQLRTAQKTDMNKVATGDSTCQQEMESSMSLAYMSNVLKSSSRGSSSPSPFPYNTLVLVAH